MNNVIFLSGTKNKNRAEKNINNDIFLTGKQSGKKHVLSSFPICSYQSGKKHKLRCFPAEKQSGKKHYPIILIFLSALLHPTVTWSPKDGVSLRRRLQGPPTVTKEIFPQHEKTS